MPEAWPADLRQLLTECMAQNSQDRPSAAQVTVHAEAGPAPLQIPGFYGTINEPINVQLTT